MKQVEGTLRLADEPRGSEWFDGDWLLEGFFDGSGKRVRTHPLTFPCRVGRNGGLTVTLPFASVSSEHAELYLAAGELHLRDLGSTNGTFLNHERVTEPVVCRDGDVIHFGRHEVRLVRQEAVLPEDAIGTGTVELDLSQGSLPNQLLLGIRKMDDLLRSRSLEAHFQPVVDLEARSNRGYEVLGRGRHSDLPQAPYELFKIAEEVGLEARLSESFRDVGLEAGAVLPADAPLYLNTHPAELCSPDELFASLAELRDRHPQVPLVLEVHESAAVGSQTMKLLQGQLQQLDIQLAYDDFGAGQSRLAELLEVPPEVVKFDMSIVRGLHIAQASKVAMIGSLIKMLRDEGVRCLAEGVETELEAAACLNLGFELAQGFLFGKPQPAACWA